MKIQFKPYYEMTSAKHALTDTNWSYLEIKDIPEDASFRQKINGQTIQVKVIDDLLASPNFVLADTGRNPNFICAKCDGPALEEGYTDNFGTTLFENEHQRLCSKCFKE